MSDIMTRAINKEFASNAHLKEADYLRMYQQSIENPETF